MRDMLFQPERTPWQPEKPGKNNEWPENYFRELDPAKRKKLLDGRDGKEDGPLLEQMRKLFDIRYRKDSRGNYADLFLRSWLELRVTAENLDAMFSQKRNRRAAQEALRSLCLDQDSEFPADLMYREMCQLTAFYIVTCSTDINYTAVLWGLGKKDDKKIREKITLDLERIGEALPKYLHMEEEFQVLQAAIFDTKKEFLRDHP